MNIKSHAKVNIFLKIVGTRGKFHKIASRFVKLDNLYDEIHFKPKSTISGSFEIEGDFGCDIKNNTIYKAYMQLEKISNKTLLQTFFKKYKVVVNKKIPNFSGLGGGSSNAAAFLRLTNRVLELNYSKEKLAKLGAKVGADVTFFIYDYDSANVTGIGDIVNLYDEEKIKIETYTPQIECNTTSIYQQFRKYYLKDIDINFANQLLEMDTKEILNTYSTSTLNDLFKPAVDLHSDLLNYNKKKWFFSGSGSTFFRMVDE